MTPPPPAEGKLACPEWEDGESATDYIDRLRRYATTLRRERDEARQAASDNGEALVQTEYALGKAVWLLKWQLHSAKAHGCRGDGCCDATMRSEAFLARQPKKGGG